MTDAVVYYSNTNRSRRIAQYFADKLGFSACDIYGVSDFGFENLVLVFPVHCQGLPDAVKAFLSRITVKNLTLIATYGRMCYGNGLNEAQRKYGHNIIAGAYVPTGHSYLSDGEFNDFGRLDRIVNKILNPSAVKIPRSYKNPFADFFKKTRGRIGVKLNKNDKCDGCGICGQVCKNGAIKDGVTNKNCVRCLKCVNECPNKALEFKLRLPMKAYLKKKKRNELIIYV